MIHLVQLTQCTFFRRAIKKNLLKPLPKLATWDQFSDITMANRPSLQSTYTNVIDNRM